MGCGLLPEVMPCGCAGEEIKVNGDGSRVLVGNGPLIIAESDTRVDTTTSVATYGL